MSLTSYKLTEDAIARKGVIAAPDKLVGTAAQNKAVFDRLIREALRELFNGLIDALASGEGASEIGMTAVAGLAGGDVQTALGSLKTLLDAKSNSADTTAALSLKSDKAVTDLHFKSVSFDANTGVFTFTREDGSYTAFDTVLEKVATNWEYDAATQCLVLTLADGTTQSVPMSAFISGLDFVDSAQIDFSVSNQTVTATVKAGSITDTMLSSELVAQLQGYVSAAGSSAADALQYGNAAAGYRDTASQKASAANNSALSASLSALASEAWAVGTEDGTDVGSLDPRWHNNAKYYAQQAAALTVGKEDAIRAASVTLSASWSGSGPYTQSVSISGATANTKVDLQPNAAALAQLLSDGVSALYIENNGGTLTAYALGAAPTAALTLQCTLTEVTT